VFAQAAAEVAAAVATRDEINAVLAERD